MNTQPQIVMQAKGLVKRFGQVTALDGMDFDLRAGEILAVIGDNGAGKSSLIKCLSGASIPDVGEIWLDGNPVQFKGPIDARRGGIETVYQDLAVAPAMSIAENLFLGREIRRPGFMGRFFRVIDKKKMLEESTARMNDLKAGIRSMNQAVETLSGGQRQQVAVGRALMTQPKVLMLDEPTAGVSPIVMDELFDRIIEVARTGISILMVEQNARQALEVADRGYVLVQGTNRFTDTGAALLADPDVRKSFLGG